MKRYNVRPSKAQSRTGFFVGIGMAILGLVIFVALIGSGQWFGILFVAFWEVMVINIAVYHYKNAYGQGEPIQHIEYEDGIDSYDEELRKLKRLYDDRIITADEFEAKKKEILGKRW